jgi:hypothetical protein
MLFRLGKMTSICKLYSADVSEELALVTPYPTLLSENAGWSDPRLRDMFNGLHDIGKTSAPWC